MQIQMSKLSYVILENIEKEKDILDLSHLSS